MKIKHQSYRETINTFNATSCIMSRGTFVTQVSTTLFCENYDCVVLGGRTLQKSLRSLKSMFFNISVELNDNSLNVGACFSCD